jgi:two-component system NtrC family sensor kinase
MQEEETGGGWNLMVEERTRELQETTRNFFIRTRWPLWESLAASVVHEINNPIAGILNLVLLIKRILKEEQENDKGKESFDRYLTLMETETRRISRIVSNMLTFSRQSQMELGTLDVNRLIDRTLMLNDNLD